MGHACRQRGAYRMLASNVLSEPAARESTQETPTIDWDELQRINPDVIAWVRVDGTDIDLPVMAASSEDPHFYLHHDLWRQEAFEGMPFLDHRCEADGAHRLVYGHHLLEGGQFSELQHAHEPDAFADIDTCWWATPSGGTQQLQPLCALSVDMWFAPIQRFRWREGRMHAWLKSLCRQADACAPGYQRLAETATSVVTLATCTSDFANQPWRTLVVFVDAEEDPAPAGDSAPAAGAG